MRILLTGFEPFGEVEDNPSQRIVEHFIEQNNPDIICEIAKVDYEWAGEGICILIEALQPDAVLLLGVAQKRKSISLERIAVNINDASIPDNAGKLIQGEQIVEDAPVGYWSTLPLDAMYKTLSLAEIPVKYSNHAGTFLCNHVMYDCLHYLARINKNIPCGFIHVPSVEAVPLGDQIKAVELCIEVLVGEKAKS